jgi:putative ABC transport system permease protein
MPRKALLRLAVRGLLLHRLRSALSILGVVFGVGAVVAMSSVGEGARREAVAQIGALGVDTISVRVAAGSGGGLRLADADAVAEVLPGAAAVAPVRLSSVPMEAKQLGEEIAIVGTTPAYRSAARLTLAAGRFVAALDVEDRKRVAVLGASVARVLFPLSNPLGQSVRLGDEWFQVVGVLESRASAKKGSPIRSRDVNRAVFVPLPSLDRGADPRPDGIDELVLRISDPEQVAAAAEVVKQILHRRQSELSLEIVVPREILRQRERTQRIFNVVTGSIAAVSLLVGGIGIMNIMLASVAERTREVGIRRALGATRRDISAQFLTESSLLTATGGALGALLGTFGSVLIQQLAGWPTALAPLSMLAALLMAVLVGVGFGLYPAWHAARLEPMQALRHE